MGHRDLLVTHNLSEGKNHERRLYLRGSVRRASGFVLTGKPEVIRRRTLDRIGGCRRTRREVVQKSSSRRSAPMLTFSCDISRSPFVDNFRLADNTAGIVAFACNVQRRL